MRRSISIPHGNPRTFLPTHPQDAVAILIFLPVALLANILAGQARLRAAESELRRREAEASHAKAKALAEQQTALRHVATLVARGVDPSEVYPVAVSELSRGLGIDNVALLRYESDEALVLLASRDKQGVARRSIGDDFRSTVTMWRPRLATGAAARVDSWTAPAAARQSASAGSGCDRRWCADHR